MLPQPDIRLAKYEEKLILPFTSCLDTVPTYVSKLIALSLTKSTWAKHRSGWNNFAEFEKLGNSIHTWPLEKKVIRDFTVWCLLEKKLKPGTVKSYISSLQLAHTLKGFDNENYNKDRLTNMLLTGAGNQNMLNPENSNTRRVFTLPLLKILGHRIATSDWPEGVKQTVWAASTLGFFSSVRMGEILSPREKTFDPNSTLLWGQVLFTKSNGLLIHIRQPKVKKTEGDFLTLFEFEESKCCPVASMKRLKMLQEEMGYEGKDKPVFCFPSGKLLTTAMLNLELKHLLRDICIPGVNDITCHSFRGAVPSAMAEHPDLVTKGELKGWGRWASDSYKKYTRLDNMQKQSLFERIKLTLL